MTQAKSKRLLSLLLSLALVLTMVAPVCAADNTPANDTPEVQAVEATVEETSEAAEETTTIAEVAATADTVDSAEAEEVTTIDTVEYTAQMVEADTSVSTASELSTAISNASDGDTITLTADVTLSSNLTINKDITLDLGGYTITTVSAYNIRISSSTTVTIQNGYITGAASKTIQVANSSASLTMSNVIVTSTYTGTSLAYAIYLDYSANITFIATNCTFTISSSKGEAVGNSSSSAGTSTVSLTNCTLSSAYRTLFLTGGSGSTVTIQGCNITTTSTSSSDAAIYLNAAKMDINIIDTTITAENGAYAIKRNSTTTSTNPAQITISGDKTNVTGSIDLSTTYTTITGGTYSTDVSKYVDGVVYTVDDSTGKYVVVTVTTTYILGLSSDPDAKPSVAATIIGEEGDSIIYAEVTATDIQTNYNETVYPTTSLVCGTSGSYLFAGWYYSLDSGSTFTAYGCDDADEGYEEFDFNTTAYAKFIDANTLSVKFQIPTDTSSDEGATAILRCISSVDCLQYAYVGFKVTVGTEKTITMKSSEILETITSTSTTYTAAETFGSTSVYFIAARLVNIPQSDYGKTITVQAFWTTLDGATVYGEAREITINYMISTIDSAS